MRDWRKNITPWRMVSVRAELLMTGRWKSHKSAHGMPPARTSNSLVLSMVNPTMSADMASSSAKSQPLLNFHVGNHGEMGTAFWLIVLFNI